MIILTFLTDFFEYLDQNYKFLWNKKIIKSFCMKISQITLFVRSLPRILWYGFWTLRNTHLPSSYLKRKNQILRRHLLWKFFFRFSVEFWYIIWNILYKHAHSLNMVSANLKSLFQFSLLLSFRRRRNPPIEWNNF